MTVKELIEKLQSLPQNHEVITDLHSEYSEVETVKLMQGYENGGYVSRPYPHRGEVPLTTHGYVYIGVRE
jgi:hypothetical protein